MRLITVQSPMFKLNSTKPMHKYNKISVTITINMNSLFVLFFIVGVLCYVEFEIN